MATVLTLAAVFLSIASTAPGLSDPFGLVAVGVVPGAAGILMVVGTLFSGIWQTPSGVKYRRKVDDIRWKRMSPTGEIRIESFQILGPLRAHEMRYECDGVEVELPSTRIHTLAEQPPPRMVDRLEHIRRVLSSDHR